jgi:hypothetical protein
MHPSTFHDGKSIGKTFYCGKLKVSIGESEVALDQSRKSKSNSLSET